jgi:cytochrome c oxidase subunit 3
MAHSTTLEPTAAATTYADAPRTGTWDGGNEPFKASYGKLMMWFFLLSDAFTFGAFLTAYGMIRHIGQFLRKYSTASRACTVSTCRWLSWH